MQELEFLLDMMSMVLLAGLCSIIFSKLKMPPIIGYLLAGILLVNVFTIPDSSKSIIEIMSHLGLVMLMFGIGMELDLAKLKKDGRFTILVAVIQLPLMMLIGFLVGKYMGFDSAACIALGAIISGSSTAVVVAVTKLQDRTSKDVINTLILVTVMEDIGQVIILSMVTPIFAGNEMDLISMVVLIIKIIAFMLASIIIGVKVLPHALDWIGKNTSSEVLLIVSIGLCFLMAYLSVYVGMSMAIGAFLMGVIVSQSVFKHELYDKVEPMKDLFMAIFFISIGMKITFDGLVSNIGLALIILSAFMIGKLITVFLGYFVGNKTITECFVCAVSLMAMGEFAFIISEEALRYEVINEGFYTAVVVAALLSMIILPLASRYTYNIVDYMDASPPRFLRKFGDDMLTLREDTYEKLEAANVKGNMKRQMTTAYGSLIILFIVEILFVNFSDLIIEGIMELTNLDYNISLQLFFFINLFALMVPSYLFVKSLKSVNSILMEGHENDERPFYRILLEFSTVTFIFIIDLVIMIIVPGPFTLAQITIMIPMMVGLLMFSIYAAIRKSNAHTDEGAGSDDGEEDGSPPSE